MFLPTCSVKSPSLCATLCSEGLGTHLSCLAFRHCAVTFSSTKFKFENCATEFQTNCKKVPQNVSKFVVLC